MSAPQSITLAVEEIADELSMLDDWMERYRHIIDLGKALPNLSDAEHTEQNLVRGCLSRVWLVADPMTADGRLQFRADGDAHIVKGLIALALRIYSGQDPKDILAHDPADTFGALGLEGHVTANRRDGFRSMLETMRRRASESLGS